MDANSTLLTLIHACAVIKCSEMNIIEKYIMYFILLYKKASYEYNTCYIMIGNST